MSSSWSARSHLQEQSTNNSMDLCDFKWRSHDIEPKSILAELNEWGVRGPSWSGLVKADHRHSLTTHKCPPWYSSSTLDKRGNSQNQRARLTEHGGCLHSVSWLQTDGPNLPNIIYFSSKAAPLPRSNSKPAEILTNSYGFTIMTYSMQWP